jgi:hypothetical protein
MFVIQLRTGKAFPIIREETMRVANICRNVVCYKNELLMPSVEQEINIVKIYTRGSARFGHFKPRVSIGGMLSDKTMPLDVKPSRVETLL